MVYEDVPICSMGVRSNFASETAQYNVFTANAVSNPLISINKGTFYDIPLDVNKDGVVLIRYSLNGNVVVKKLNMTKS